MILGLREGVNPGAELIPVRPAVSPSVCSCRDTADADAPPEETSSRMPQPVMGRGATWCGMGAPHVRGRVWRGIGRLLTVRPPRGVCVCVCNTTTMCVCNTPTMVYAAALVMFFWAGSADWVRFLRFSGHSNIPPSPESTVTGTTNLGDAQSGAGKGREVLAYPLIRLGHRASQTCLSRAGLWLGALPEADRPGEHERDVPTLLSVLQKGAYWRQTCFVLFGDQTDEDSGTRNLSCARFALQ